MTRPKARAHGFLPPSSDDDALAAGRRPGTFKTSAAEKRDVRNPYVIALELQLGRLRRLEDPSNDSPTAVVYREMLAAADKTAADGTRATRGWGEYSACGDPRKRRTAAS